MTGQGDVLSLYNKKAVNYFRAALLIFALVFHLFMWMKNLVCVNLNILHLDYKPLSLSGCPRVLFQLLQLIFESYWKKNACQMLAVFWHMISSDVKWAHKDDVSRGQAGLSSSTFDTRVSYEVVLQAQLYW